MRLWWAPAPVRMGTVKYRPWRNSITGPSNPYRVFKPIALSRKYGKIFIMFNVLLTVHHAMILGNCPTWRTNTFQCIYLFIVLYMFRACHAHHQEKQIVSIQLLKIVTPCWWQCRLLVGSKLPTSYELSRSVFVTFVLRTPCLELMSSWLRLGRLRWHHNDKLTERFHGFPQPLQKIPVVIISQNYISSVLF